MLRAGGETVNEPLPVVGEDAIGEIAALCGRAVGQPFTVDELRRALFAPEQPARVRFAPGVGVVATVRPTDPDRARNEGFVRLIAVDPAGRGHGHGRALLAAAEADLSDARVVTIGADAPYFLFPGVPTSETALCSLLERHHYGREETNYNVVVPLEGLAPAPNESITPGPDERAEVSDWMAEHWPHWRLEVLRAFDAGGLLLARNDDGIAAFCAYDVNRAGTLGPVAVRPDLIGRGVGRTLLLDALHRLRARGHRQIDVLWVGPLVPYARVGGRIGATFFVYRKRRPT